MHILFLGLTISVIGKVFLAIGVLWAHSEIAHEHRIDNKVLHSFRLERIITVVGLLLIVLGYGLEIYFYGFTPFLQCIDENCTAAVMTGFSQ